MSNTTMGGESDVEPSESSTDIQRDQGCSAAVGYLLDTVLHYITDSVLGNRKRPRDVSGQVLSVFSFFSLQFKQFSFTRFDDHGKHSSIINAIDW